MLHSNVRIFSAVLFAAVVSAITVFACNSNPPASTPPAATAVQGETSGTVLGVGNQAATALAKKRFGMNVNYTPEVGAVVVESGVFEWPKAAADSTAEGGLGETSIGLIGPGPYNIPISQCQFHTAAALTASTTSYAVLSVYKRNQDGGTQTLLAQVSTGDAASWAPFTNILVPAVSGAFVAPGDSVTFVITKTGPFGAIVPQGELACFTSLN